MRQYHATFGVPRNPTAVGDAGDGHHRARNEENVHSQLLSSENAPLIELESADILNFDFTGKPVRTRCRDGQVWFLNADVCAVLEIANASDAIAKLDPDERGSAIADTPGGKQEMALISESGLYALIFTSRKPQAKAFRRWVTQIVLPSIRKTGRYDASPTHGAREPAAVGGQMVNLPSYGRFVVMNAPEGLQVDYAVDAIPQEFAALDCFVLSYRVKMIEGLWQRYKQVSSLGDVCRDGFSRQSLEQAIVEAGAQAQRHIAAYGEKQKEAEGPNRHEI